MATIPEDTVFDEALEAVHEAIAGKDYPAALAVLKAADVDAVAKLIDRLDIEERQALFAEVSPDEAASLLGKVYYFQSADILGDISPAAAAPIIAQFDSDDRADILNELETGESSAILEALDADIAEETRQFMAYPEGTAGATMYSEFLSFRGSQTVQVILEDLRNNREFYNEFGIQYAYVLGRGRKLIGVLPVRNLIFAQPNQTAEQIMIGTPISVRAETEVSELESIFEQHAFLGLPVVDDKNRLIGVVDRAAASEAIQEAVTQDMLKMQGLMGKEELRSMPLKIRSKRRLSWLSINIVLNLISASVIAFFQGTLEAVIALAVFLPIISDMSGCSGNQAVAVSMRELTLGLVSPRDAFRVFIKESSVGVINGTLLGILIGLIALVWKGNAVLGLVVGIALALNTTVAVCVGGLVPLLLKGFKQDPALASGPILTTVTDMCGFMLLLGLASLFLPYLV